MECVTNERARSDTFCLLHSELRGHSSIITIRQMRHVNETPTTNSIIRRANDHKFAVRLGNRCRIHWIAKRHNRVDLGHCICWQRLSSAANDEGALGVSGYDDFGVGAVV